MQIQQIQNLVYRLPGEATGIALTWRSGHLCMMHATDVMITPARSTFTKRMKILIIHKRCDVMIYIPLDYRFFSHEELFIKEQIII